MAAMAMVLVVHQMFVSATRVFLAAIAAIDTAQKDRLGQ
jgi:hypothetical protein